MFTKYPPGSHHSAYSFVHSEHSGVVVARQILGLMLLLFLVLSTAITPAHAQTSPTRTADLDAPAESEARGLPTMLVLDNSGSMTTEDADGQSRSDAAKDATQRFIDELNNTLDLGLVTYGGNTGDTPAEQQAGCEDVTMVRAPKSGDTDELSEHINSLEPRGYTPIAKALITAADELPNDEGGTIVLVSDGLDMCAPPPVCEVAADLHDKGLDLIINTVGFNVDENARRELECIADAAGGTYADAGNADDLVAELQRATTRKAIGYESDFPMLEGGEKKDEATPIPEGTTEFQTLLTPPAEGRDNWSQQFWSIPVADAERVQVTTTYSEQTTTGNYSGEYLGIRNILLMPGGKDEKCERGMGGDPISDSGFPRPVVASVESDRIGIDCDTDELILLIERGNVRLADEDIPVEVLVTKLPSIDGTGLPEGKQKREIPALNPANVDSWEPITPGNWFTNATELTSGEGVEAEIVTSENQFFKIPMHTGQQFRAYFEVVENSWEEDSKVGDQFGIAVYSPTRQNGGVSMRDNIGIGVGQSGTSTAEVPLTYLNMFPAEDGFGTNGSGLDIFTLEGDYYIVMNLADFGGELKNVSDNSLPVLKYRLVAEAFGDAQPGPVYQVSEDAMSEETPAASTAEGESTAGIAQVSDDDSGSNLLINGGIFALILLLVGGAGWWTIKKRK